MTGIKTREYTKGSIKTIDRVLVMTEHIRQANIKIKDSSITDRNASDNPDTYAQNHVAEYGRVVANEATRAGIATAKQVHMKKDSLEINKRKDNLLKSIRMNEESRVLGLGTDSFTSDQKRCDIHKRAMLDKAKNDVAARISSRMKTDAINSKKGIKGSMHRATRFAQRIIDGEKTLTSAIGVAGSAAVVIIVVCVLFGAAFYFFGDDSSSCIPVSPEVEV